MPLKIPAALPAHKILNEENIFVMTEERAVKQDIRPLKIVILNLMPTKIVTETQLLRVIGNTPLQVEPVFLHTASHKSKNTSKEHLESFYKTFDEISHAKFDGMIITGAPVEMLRFEEVFYWDELRSIMEWTKSNVFSTMNICWGAQAALYFHYGIQKYPLDKKMFGVFKHRVLNRNSKLMRGFDDEFFAPHSRNSYVDREDILACDDIELLAESDEAGVYIAASRDCKNIFVTGHSEYDADTLAIEYWRDVDKGLDIDIPHNFYPDDDPSKNPVVTWRSHGNLLFQNWLNYYVYQETPYDLTRI